MADSKVILLVEDDADTRDSVEDLLEAESYAVVPARTGKQALDFLMSETEPKPDAVILDLMVPIITGWQVLAAMRSNPRLASIPVLVVTAVLQDRPAGAATVLVKPFSAEALLGWLRENVDGGHNGSNGHPGKPAGGAATGDLRAT
jgi:DNA-binding response OmpR family regulator